MQRKEGTSVSGIQPGGWEPDTHPGFSAVTRATWEDRVLGSSQLGQGIGLGSQARLWGCGV